jgi:cytochrome P450
MSEFIPPYPKRHEKDLNPLLVLYYARKDLLSIWPESAFSQEFMSEKILKQHVFVANSPDVIRHVLVTNHQNYERKSMQMKRALEPILGDGLFISEGDTWKERRGMQTHLFDNSHIKMYSSSMIETINEMADRWAELPSGSTINVHPEMAKLTAEIISRNLFGAELGAKNAEAVVSAFADYQSVINQMSLSNFLGMPDWMPNVSALIGKAHKSAKNIHAIVDQIIAKTAEGNHKDTLATYLMEANHAGHQGCPVSGELTKEQIRNEIIVLFMAGHETTANVLAWAWYLISQSPDVAAKFMLRLMKFLAAHNPRLMMSIS